MSYTISCQHSLPGQQGPGSLGACTHFDSSWRLGAPGDDGPLAGESPSGRRRVSRLLYLLWRPGVAPVDGVGEILGGATRIRLGGTGAQNGSDVCHLQFSLHAHNHAVDLTVCFACDCFAMTKNRSRCHGNPNIGASQATPGNSRFWLVKSRNCNTGLVLRSMPRNLSNCFLNHSRLNFWPELIWKGIRIIIQKRRYVNSKDRLCNESCSIQRAQKKVSQVLFWFCVVTFHRRFLFVIDSTKR